MALLVGGHTPGQFQPHWASQDHVLGFRVSSDKLYLQQSPLKPTVACGSRLLPSWKCTWLRVSVLSWLSLGGSADEPV